MTRLARDLAEQRRDQALADLLDLHRQVAAREIPGDVADKLRAQYETTAAQAIEELETAPEPGPPEGRQRRSPARGAAYLIAAVVAVVAAAVLLPQYVSTRPDGGFVTGNEVSAPAAESPAERPPGRDLSTVTNAEMEQVIEANPDVVGMRVALARRYLDEGEYDKAGDHLGEALKRDPGNPDAHAASGWLLHQLGDTDAALRFLATALRIDPGHADALWYQANIQLDRRDPAGALATLRQLLRQPDLPADLRTQATRLLTTARQQEGRR